VNEKNTRAPEERILFSGMVEGLEGKVPLSGARGYLGRKEK